MLTSSGPQHPRRWNDPSWDGLGGVVEVPLRKQPTSLINTCAFKEKFVPKIKWSLRYLYPRTNAWMSTTWNIKSKQRKIMENQRTSLEFNKQREQQNNVKRPLWHMKKRWKFHHSTSVITEATFNKLQNVWQLQDLMASNDGFQESPVSFRKIHWRPKFPSDGWSDQSQTSARSQISGSTSIIYFNLILKQSFPYKKWFKFSPQKKKISPRFSKKRSYP